MVFFFELVDFEVMDIGGTCLCGVDKECTFWTLCKALVLSLVNA